MTDEADDDEPPFVAPFTGVWIEMVQLTARRVSRIVAPFAGAWIEIRLMTF